MSVKKYFKYFAYGSNMDLKQMKERCPSSKFLKVVRLENYKFVYDGYSTTRKGAVANIVEDKDSVVYGALFLITEDDEKRLDRYEGYPKSYKKKCVIVKDEEGKEYKALVYCRDTLEVRPPSKEYECIVVKAAYALSLPSDYIERYLKVRKHDES